MTPEQRKRQWKATPASFAQHASAGRWVAYPWVQKVSLIVAQAILNGNGRILLSAPPQHGKSQLLSNWLPTWFLHNLPKRRVILGTYSQRYANKWGAAVRENLLHNPWAAIPMRVDTKSKQLFVTQEGGQMMVAGVDGPATGESADLFVVDDPYKSMKDAMSEAVRETVESWFRSVATTRVQSGGSIVVMHTRWMDDDLIGTLAKEQGWTYLNFQAVCEDPEHDPMGRSLGDPLCPERFTGEDLTRIRREVTDLFWFPMYQGQSVDAKGSIVNADDIQYFDEDPLELAKTLDEVAIFADLTYEKDEENDYTVVELWGRTGSDVYLLAQTRAQMGITEQLQAIQQMAIDHPTAFHKEIEKKANGAAVIELLSSKIVGIVANNPMTSKGARLAAVSPLYKAKNVHYPNPAKPGNEWVKQNVYEVTRMTLAGTKAKHDDTVDVASMALRHFGNMNSAIAALDALIAR